MDDDDDPSRQAPSKPRWRPPSRSRCRRRRRGGAPSGDRPCGRRQVLHAARRAARPLAPRRRRICSRLPPMGVEPEPWPRRSALVFGAATRRGASARRAGRCARPQAEVPAGAVSFTAGWRSRRAGRAPARRGAGLPGAPAARRLGPPRRAPPPRRRGSTRRPAPPPRSRRSMRCARRRRLRSAHLAGLADVPPGGGARRAHRGRSGGGGGAAAGRRSAVRRLGRRAAAAPPPPPALRVGSRRRAAPCVAASRRSARLGALAKVLRAAHPRPLPRRRRARRHRNSARRPDPRPRYIEVLNLLLLGQATPTSSTASATSAATSGARRARAAGGPPISARGFALPRGRSFSRQRRRRRSG